MSERKLLILSVFPAPYRADLFSELLEEYKADVFFERNYDDNRDSSYFVKHDAYHILDNKEDLEYYDLCVKSIKSYDCVCLYDYTSVRSIRLALKCLVNRIPYVLNCDGVILTKHGNFLKDLVKRIMVKHARKCFASGRYAKQYFTKYGAKNENVIIHTFSALHQGDMPSSLISKDQKKELREKLKLPVESRIAVAVGRFIKLKRFDVLIREWKNMPGDYHLLVIGGGEEESEYQKIIKDCKLENVIIEKYHPFSELLQYYQACDVLIHPTLYDAWGLIINEAMCCGLPIISSDRCIAGLELISDYENGFIVELENDEEYINKAKYVMDNKDVYEIMRTNNFSKIRDYSIENMAAIHKAAIRGIIHEEVRDNN